jgi:hypothetical protein
VEVEEELGVCIYCSENGRRDIHLFTDVSIFGYYDFFETC